MCVCVCTCVCVFNGVVGGRIAENTLGSLLCGHSKLRLHIGQCYSSRILLFESLHKGSVTRNHRDFQITGVSLFKVWSRTQNLSLGA